MYFNVSDVNFNKYIIIVDKNISDLQKLAQAFAYIYFNLLNDFDWILKTNDNTYMVMENLRWLLYKYDPSKALLIGQLNAAKVRFFNFFNCQIIYFSFQDFNNRGLCHIQKSAFRIF